MAGAVSPSATGKWWLAPFSLFPCPSRLRVSLWEPAQRSLGRERCEHRIQAIDRAVLEAPGADLSEIDMVEPLDGQHIPGIVEILPPPPAKFLHDEIFRPGEPCRPAQAR